MKKVLIIISGILYASCTLAQGIIKGNVGVFHSVSGESTVYYFSGSPLHSNASSDSKLVAPFIQLNELVQARFKVKCFPNPANDLVFCQLSNNKPIKKLGLYSMDGSYMNNFDKSPIDVRHLKSGVYILEALDETNTVYTNKITIIH